jgi:hypothetical protein
MPSSPPAIVLSEADLRLSLWLHHGHDMLYGDDGEMQCPRCGLDFLRAPLSRIQSHLATLEPIKLI